MAGALLTFYVGAVNAEGWTRITWTFWIWVMVIIGGAANNAGVALGAFSFTFLFKIVDQVKFYFQGSIPFDVNWLEYLMFASLLILILAFRPGGILPEKSSVTLPWRTVAETMRPKSKVGANLGSKMRTPEPAKVDLADEPSSTPTT
jgi:branched-chain amino acid transport system permease protein